MLSRYLVHLFDRYSLPTREDRGWNRQTYTTKAKKQSKSTVQKSFFPPHFLKPWFSLIRVAESKSNHQIITNNKQNKNRRFTFQIFIQVGAVSCVCWRGWNDISGFVSGGRREGSRRDDYGNTKQVNNNNKETKRKSVLGSKAEIACWKKPSNETSKNIRMVWPFWKPKR